MDNNFEEKCGYKNELIHLLKCAILNEKPQINLKEIDFKELFTLAKKHGVDNILYYALKNTDASEEILDICKKSLYIAAAVDGKQEYYVKLLSQKFSENNIRFMMLKGRILKKIYPASDMRKSGDIDILFEDKDSEKVKNLMIENGFEVVDYGENDIHDEYRKGEVVIEMHRALINEKYFEWGEMCNHIEKSWILKDGCEYVLSDEDYYLYMVAHMAKHMKYGGIGIRFILDIWVYLRKYNDTLNWKFINQKLEAGKLLKFEQICKSLSDIWFENGKHNDTTKALEEYIVSGGLFGLKSRYVISDYVINQGTMKMTIMKKLKRFRKVCFIPYSQMKGKYPILSKLPILLPFCWGHRIFKAVFFKRERVKEIANYFDNVNISDAEKMDRFKKSIGL